MKVEVSFGRNLQGIFSALTKAIVLLVTVLAFHAQAEVQLVVWEPLPNQPRVLIPRLPTESPQQAVKNYLRHFARHEELRLLIPNGVNIELYSGRAWDFQRKSQETLLTGFIGSQVRDMIPHGSVPRMERIIGKFSMGSIELESYVIAPAAGARLTEQRRAEWNSKIAHLFEYVIGLGGEDWSRRLYENNGLGPIIGEDVNSNHTLDETEFSLREQIIKVGHAYEVWICRSHQSGLTILLKGRLIADLEAAGYGSEHDHRGPLRVEGESRLIAHSIFIREDSRVAEDLQSYILRNRLVPKDGFYEIPSNSWHRQAFDWKNPFLSPIVALPFVGRPVGFDSFGVLEVYEAPNITSFQNHIELPIPGHGNEIGDLLILGTKNRALTWRSKQRALKTLDVPSCRKAALRRAG